MVTSFPVYWFSNNLSEDLQKYSTEILDEMIKGITGILSDTKYISEDNKTKIECLNKSYQSVKKFREEENKKNY